ncbi:MAG: DISARM system SNF2-like helicase DrmD [Planctomycetota bacterium]
MHPEAMPKPGQAAKVRNRPAVVEDVSVSGSGHEGAYHAVTVRYIDGWSHPARDTLIWEREDDAEVFDQLPWPDIESTNPDQNSQFNAFLDANRWSALNKLGRVSHNDGAPRLISPWHSAIQIEDYQLYPLLKALLMPRVSLLLADDVGLGKTIEAGLIMSELLVRRHIRRILVICPASLQKQWQEEMHEKFHVDFTIVDRNKTFELQRTLGMDSNPWSTYPRIITSQDYLRQRDVLSSFQAATRTFSRGDQSLLPWDLLIVDEAHNFSPSYYGDDSQRCRMLRELSKDFEHRLFLTATPHDGYTLSFSGLLEMLDPVRFEQKAELDERDHEQKKLVMVRRLKSELSGNGNPNRFARRMPPRGLKLDFSPRETRLYSALRSYRDEASSVLRKKGRQEWQIGSFLTSLLTKRLLSSPYAFAWTWWQHVEGLELTGVSVSEVEHARKRAETPVDDDQEKDLRDQDAARQGGGWLTQFATALRDEMDAVGDALTRLGWTPEALDAGLGDLADFPADAKWQRLERWIDENLMEGGALREDERLIVFTEYKHSLDYIIARLAEKGLKAPQVEQLFGGAPTHRREQVKDSFNDPQSPLRILVATDTAAEGINLQTSCRYVIHYEIPWNPMRLEQRNGRVDRHGQPRDVYLFHFTSEEEADLKFLGRVVEKVQQVREDLGTVGQVIDAAVMEHFTESALTDEELDRRVNAVPQAEQSDLLAARKDLYRADHGSQAHYDQAFQQLRATEMSLGLTEQNLARLLQQAMRLEDGRLEETPGEPGTYVIRQIPPGWKRLVRDSLEIERGSLRGQLPRLVFDPCRLERDYGGLRIFQTRPDLALIRLGHPLMQRALGVLRRALWEQDREDSVHRWTAESCPLPAGIDQVLILHLLLEANNELRETIHQDIITVPFRVQGSGLSMMENELWQEVSNLPRDPLPQEELREWAARARQNWMEHKEALSRCVATMRKSMESELEDRMEEHLESELERTRKRYEQRLRELGQRARRRKYDALKAELDEKRRELQQERLWAEMRNRLERQVRELEWEVYHSHVEELRRFLKEERERTVQELLPKRYSMASLNLQPMAVQYLVPDGREGGA